MRPSILSQFACVSWVAALAGCGPSKLLPPPTHMPAEIDGRSLWNTPLAVIYAKDKAVAGEAETMARDLDGELQKCYQRGAGRGLIIVNDINDAHPLIRTLEEAERLERARPTHPNKPATTTQPTSGPSDEDRKEMEELGMTEEVLCRMIVAPLDAEFLRGIGLTDDACAGLDWFICCPSKRQARDAIAKITDAAIKKEGGFAMKLVVAPWMPLILSEAAKKMEAGTKLIIVESWAMRQTDWDTEKRRQIVREMTKRLGVFDEPDFVKATSQPTTNRSPES